MIRGTRANLRFQIHCPILFFSFRLRSLVLLCSRLCTNLSSLLGMFCLRKAEEHRFARKIRPAAVCPRNAKSRKRVRPVKLGHVARFHEIYLIKVVRANQARADTHTRSTLESRAGKQNDNTSDKLHRHWLAEFARDYCETIERRGLFYDPTSNSR